MQDVIFGLVALAAGALFCFRGYLAFRIVIPVWGAFVGFGAGAGLVASITGDGFLRTGVAWAVGLVTAIAFAVLAYLFFEVAIVIGMVSIGFALGTSAMVALDVSWTWLVVLVGVVVGALLAAVAIAVDLPMLLLVVLSALGGASAITTGVMLLVGTIDTRDFDDDDLTTRAADGWWWYAVYAGLAAAGIVSQVRGADRLRRSVRASWAERD
ncbi:MAG: DUF4203 domain-containing protein [Thermoleophilia bacterium]|nr:DUF4203 domain-containing protein [Thermoleophilia bacterium]